MTPKLFVLLLGLWLPLVPATALAASNTPTTAGIALTPAIQDRALAPSDKSVEFSIQLANHSDEPRLFSLSVTDFKALNQTGGVAFLGNSPRNLDHGLSGFLRLPSTQIMLAPNSVQTIVARVPDVSQLAPGGHYGAILAQVVPSSSTAKGNRVSVNQVVSSLIFLETAGQGTKTLQLLPPAVDGLSFKLPTQSNLVFKATGNTQTVPRGVVTIARGQTVVSQGIINENSSLILPGSTRLLQTNLHNVKNAWLPGVYTLRVAYRYEGSLGITTYQKKFVYINLLTILALLAIGVAVAFLGLRLRGLWTRLLAKRATPVLVRRVISVRHVSPDPQAIAVSKKPKK